LSAARRFAISFAAMTRPRGLTVLAVTNFLCALLAMLGAKISYDLAVDGIFGDANRSLSEATGLEKLSMVTSMAIALLLLLSGIGYLQLRRVLGRFVGNLYVLVSLTTAVAALALGGAVGIAHLIVIACMIHPILTAVMINGEYKSTLVS
jgi:hypothetical protein